MEIKDFFFFSQVIAKIRIFSRDPFTILSNDHLTKLTFFPRDWLTEFGFFSITICWSSGYFPGIHWQNLLCDSMLFWRNLQYFSSIAPKFVFFFSTIVSWNLRNFFPRSFDEINDQQLGFAFFSTILSRLLSTIVWRNSLFFRDWLTQFKIFSMITCRSLVYFQIQVGKIR